MVAAASAIVLVLLLLVSGWGQGRFQSTGPLRWPTSPRVLGLIFRAATPTEMLSWLLLALFLAGPFVAAIGEQNQETQPGYQWEDFAAPIKRSGGFMLEDPYPQMAKRKQFYAWAGKRSGPNTWQVPTFEKRRFYAWAGRK
ncbi:unnamed protein product, partial [Mesorhabditis spiculigera]